MVAREEYFLSERRLARAQKWFGIAFCEKVSCAKEAKT
jgi:hypothetical protein